MDTRTVVISGASRGLGAATACIAAEMGANVVLTARSGEDLDMVAQQIQASGGRALSVVGDITRVADCQRVIDQAMNHFGQVHTVVNNAGVLTPIASIADGEPEAWEENWAVNLLGPVMLTRAALPYLRQCSGRVISVSDGAAVKVIPGWAAYSAAKAALNHLTQMLAVEEPAVTAVAFRPGVVDTDMQATIRREGAKGMPADVHSHFLRYHEEGELLPPQVPGCSLAVLALHAPQKWSGLFLSWNDEQVLSLVRRFATATCAPDRKG
jgi:NAD(P)-dependent dehydrogenase (short-subunit alcohol dehydrogenase family)